MPVQIAVIDDETDVLDIIKYNLDKEGFQVSVYSDCESALEGFGSQRLPDLIICDWMLPGMSGFDLLKQLKTNLRYKLIPFIMVTCHNTSRFITEALNNGADDYLTKPFKLKELVARVHKRLNQVDKKQHLLLEEDFRQADQKNLDHIDSLKSAKRIQSAVLPSQNYFLNKYTQSFIFNKPKDVVSGDFFWYAECYDNLFITVADCTGHGVPGALTSMMGNMFLNQLVFDKRIMDAGTILKELNAMMVNALNNQTHTERMYEGMDIGLIIIDPRQGSMQFAGALHNLWLVKENKLEECKGMRYPIGGLQVGQEKSFITHHFTLQPKDRIYLKTDGFADQFGKQGKKFLSKRLKQTLVSMQQFPIQLQQLELESIFDLWKGDMEQTDDVLLFGWEMN